MTSTSDAKDLLNELANIRKDISVLRTNLNELNDKKEALFDEKEKHSKKIISIIHDIKSLKRERDEYTNKVKSFKEERKHLNDSIKTSSEDLNKFLSEKDAIQDKKQIKGNPSLIKKKIEEMQFKIETEGMSFENEKKMMLKINELKKELDGSREFMEVSDKIRVSRNNIRDSRRKANFIHKSVQDNAKNSQERHEKIITLSKEIDELKKNEKDAFTKFVEAKEEFNKVNDALKEKLVEMNRINEELKKHKIKTKEEIKDKEIKTLAEKSKQVDEKIKGRKKLTTEDLLVYQKTMSNQPEEIIEPEEDNTDSE